MINMHIDSSFKAGGDRTRRSGRCDLMSLLCECAARADGLALYSHPSNCSRICALPLREPSGLDSPSPRSGWTRLGPRRTRSSTSPGPAGPRTGRRTSCRADLWLRERRSQGYSRPRGHGHGTDLVFQTDFPQAASTWPDSKAVAEQLCKDAALDDDEIYKLMRGNAIRRVPPGQVLRHRCSPRIVVRTGWRADDLWAGEAPVRCRDRG
jgi:hypothetical protein